MQILHIIINYSFQLVVSQYETSYKLYHLYRATTDTFSQKALRKINLLLIVLPT